MLVLTGFFLMVEVIMTEIDKEKKVLKYFKKYFVV